jgi:hypothetical protein
MLDDFKIYSRPLEVFWYMIIFCFPQKKEKKVQKTFTVLEVHVDEHFRTGNSDTNHKYRVASHTGILKTVEVSAGLPNYYDMS